MGTSNAHNSFSLQVFLQTRNSPESTIARLLEAAKRGADIWLGTVEHDLSCPQPQRYALNLSRIIAVYVGSQTIRTVVSNLDGFFNGVVTDH
jgi:hypothetical protein